MGRPAKITPDAIEFAVSEMSKGFKKCNLKKLLKEKFDLSARSSETVFARAREEMMRRAGIGMDEVRGNLANFLLEIMGESSEPLLARLRAAEQYAKLYGANRPERIEVSGPDGGDIKVSNKPNVADLTPEQLAVLRSALKKKE